MVSMDRLRAVVNGGVTADDDCHAEVRRLTDVLAADLDVTPIPRTGLFLVDPTDDQSMDYQHSWILIPAEDLAHSPEDALIDPTVQQFADPSVQPDGVAPLDTTDDVLIVSMRDAVTDHYYTPNLNV